MAKNERRTNLTESEIINETPRDILPTSRLPRGLDGDYRDILRTDQGPGGIGEDGEGGLPYPTNIEIEHMEIGFNPDGSQFVDVIIGFDEVEGATNYESRITAI